MTNIIFHQFEGISVGLDKRSGYLNATRLCAAYNIQNGTSKQPSDWTKTKRAKDYIAYVASVQGLLEKDLIESIQGGDDQGTWIHPGLKDYFTEWLYQKSNKDFHEKSFQLRLAEQLGGNTEVVTPVGTIDVLTATEIIEVKKAKLWKSALGQILAYGHFFPSHKKRIHLLGIVHTSAYKTIESIASTYGVSVTYE